MIIYTQTHTGRHTGRQTDIRVLSIHRTSSSTCTKYNRLRTHRYTFTVTIIIIIMTVKLLACWEVSRPNKMTELKTKTNTKLSTA